MMQLVLGSRGDSPPRHQGHQGIPLFPECRAAIKQEFLEFIGQDNPISEAAIQENTFVSPWCSWCLGGSTEFFGHGRGRGHGYGYGCNAVVTLKGLTA
jgi:hypothetical protein